MAPKQSYIEGFHAGYSAGKEQFYDVLTKLINVVDKVKTPTKVYVVINEGSILFRTSSIWTEEEEAIKEVQRFKDEEGPDYQVHYEEMDLNDSIF